MTSGIATSHGMDHHSPRPRMRPRFEIELGAPSARVLAALRRQLGQKDAGFAGIVHARQAELRIAEERAHFWSPCLSLEIGGGDVGPSVLRGRFAPDPSVWMMFMGIYGVLAMGAALAAMFGVSQVMLHEAPWAFLGVPAALAAMAFVYGATFIGQGLAAAEMYALRSFVDDAVTAAGTSDAT